MICVLWIVLVASVAEELELHEYGCKLTADWLSVITMASRWLTPCIMGVQLLQQPSTRCLWAQSCVPVPETYSTVLLAAKGCSVMIRSMRTAWITVSMLCTQVQSVASAPVPPGRPAAAVRASTQAEGSEAILEHLPVEAEP